MLYDFVPICEAPLFYLCVCGNLSSNLYHDIHIHLSTKDMPWSRYGTLHTPFITQSTPQRRRMIIRHPSLVIIL